VGLVQLDPQTGQGTLVMAATGTIEDLSWDNEGVLLYAVAANQLWAFNSQTQSPRYHAPRGNAARTLRVQ